MIAFLIPWFVPIGGLSISPYRLALLAMTIPSLVFWISGKAGRIRLADVSILFFCAWSAVSFTVVHGANSAIEPAGMQFLETGGAYFVARSFVRSRQDFRLLCKVLFISIAVLLPFALIHNLFGINVLLRAFGAILPTLQEEDTGRRVGFWRAQGPFDHPILFGVYTGSILALTHMVLGRNQPLLRRWLMSGVVVITAATSLSAGPITAVLAQALLMGWNAAFRKVPGRWLILWGFGLAFYAAAEMFTTQSVLSLYITKFAFDVQSAWQRMLLMDYGWGSVFNHPYFGVGFNDWDHPSWMYYSIDMFWLVPFIRHGLPGGGSFMLAFFAATFVVGFRKCVDEELIAYRTAYLIGMTGFFIVGWTVHFWGAPYAMFNFLIGSGMWLIDANPKPAVNGKIGGRQRHRTLERNSREAA